MSDLMAGGAPAALLEDDEARLAQLGYKQELRRRMSGFSNFAVSFSIISILAGCITLYGTAMNNGGPLDITIGWLFIGGMVTLVGLAMAEVCSVYPTAGGLYWWAFAVAKRNKAAWAWFTGWFNFLGQVAVTAGIDYGAALTTTALLSIQFPSFTASVSHTFYVFLVIIALHGLLNTFGVNLVKVLSDISVWWHVVGVLVIVGVLAIKPSHHYSLASTFGHTVNFGTGITGHGGLVYALLIGLLMAQYTFTGYDASAHLSEETHEASRTAPRGIVMSIVVSLVAGFVLLFAVTWSIQNYKAEAGATFPPAQIFLDATGQTLGKLLLLICVVAQFFCGMASVTANSRMAFAFSRDGALPGSRWWRRVNPRTGTPTNSIWLCVVCSIVLVLPVLWNNAAYVAATSVAVIGLYVAYVLPVLLRLRDKEFQVGPWNLGRWSGPIGWTAVIWVGIICVLFILPTTYPITYKNFNYTVVAVAVVLGGAWLGWMLSARRWFRGPVPNIDTPDGTDLGMLITPSGIPVQVAGATAADATVADYAAADTMVAVAERDQVGVRDRVTETVDERTDVDVQEDENGDVITTTTVTTTRTVTELVEEDETVAVADETVTGE